MKWTIIIETLKLEIKIKPKYIINLQVQDCSLQCIHNCFIHMTEWFPWMMLLPITFEAIKYVKPDFAVSEDKVKLCLTSK